MLSKTLEKERKELDRVADVKGLLTKLTERSQPDSGDPLSLNECAETFVRLQTDFRHEYVMYGLSRLAIPVVFPLLKEATVGWSPLTDSDTLRLNIFSQWRELLADSSSESGSHVPSEDK